MNGARISSLSCIRVSFLEDLKFVNLIDRKTFKIIDTKTLFNEPKDVNDYRLASLDLLNILVHFRGLDLDEFQNDRIKFSVIRVAQ